MSCFGCGHQSHIKCAFCKNQFEECIICKRDGIGDDENLNQIFKKDMNNDNNNNNEIKEEVKDIGDKNKKIKDKNKKVFMFGIREDKIKKMIQYDKKYLDEFIDIL